MPWEGGLSGNLSEEEDERLSSKQCRFGCVATQFLTHVFDKFSEKNQK
jgi:hypothetical protein